MDKIYTFFNQVKKAMDSGKLDQALRLIREIHSMGELYLTSNKANSFLINTSGLLIDIGNSLDDQQIIKEGMYLLSDNFERITSDAKYSVIAHYNLGNGYSAIFNKRRKQEHLTAYFSDTELNFARDHYNKALKCPLKESFTTSQIWVNLGNCFDTLGRVLDALECYEKAIALEPKHGMALGNKGIGLYCYAKISGEHQGTFLKEAYSLLSQALESEVNAEAVPYFKKYHEEIKRRFKGSEGILKNLSEYKGISIKGDSEIEKFLIKFCRDNKLYLNICNYCQRCDGAIGDTATIKKMIVPLTKQQINNAWPQDDDYLRLSKYVNQIKQDYVTARFLVILSRYNGLNIDFVHKYVKIIDTLDYSLHNIRVELVKAAFRSFYGVLDKIAYFINDYLGLEIPSDKIYFHTIWYKVTSKKREGVREEIIATQNSSLNALFSLHQDLEYGELAHLKLLRNKLTHRFVDITLFQLMENTENMSEDSLVDMTLELARTTRNAILYLLQFVNKEESGKERHVIGHILNIYAQEIPDDLK